MSDKCTKCDGSGLVVTYPLDSAIVMTNCPDCHGLGRCGE